MKMTKDEFKLVERWFYRNARPLDMARWKYHFEGGSADDVARIMECYQAADGGLGNGIEADLWNPRPCPATTARGIVLLHEVGFDDRESDLAKGIVRYCFSSTDWEDGKWAHDTASNNDYPHAEYLEYPTKNIYDWGFEPSGKLLGFLLYFAPRDGEDFARALEMSKHVVDVYLHSKMDDGTPYKDVRREGELSTLIHLCEMIDRAELADEFPQDEFKQTLAEKVDLYIVKDTTRWETEFCYKGSTFITRPDSFLYKGNEEIIDTEMDYLLEHRNAEGSWDVSFGWSIYPEQSPIAAHWWQADAVLVNTMLLKNFGHIED